jgi:hypothetical protein
MFGFSMNKLNERSLNMVKTVYKNFKNHPSYREFSVSMTEHDIEGSASITITKYGQNVNKFYFYPASSGNIASIAIYGAELGGHLNSIRNSMNIFGLKVDEVEMVTNSASPFVDVYLEQY